MATRPKTSPETPVPKALAREYAMGEMSADLEWIKSTLSELKGREYTCYKESELSSLKTWRKILSGILAAVALTLLGSMSVFLVTCENQSEARGAAMTRIENHSTRINTVEQSLRRLEDQQQQSTTAILTAIRESRAESRTDRAESRAER